jgi:hypothetical protein
MDMGKFYQEKYGWKDKTTDNIWWLIHRKSFPNFNASIQTTLIKFIHGRLPCNHRENIYYEYKSPLCSACGIQTETQEHVIQCNCEGRNLIKKNYN